MDHWNQYTKLGLFFLPLLLSISFNQTTTKHSLCETYTRTIQKGPMWCFLVLGFTLEEKLRREKCCESERVIFWLTLHSLLAGTWLVGLENRIIYIIFYSMYISIYSILILSTQSPPSIISFYFSLTKI